MTLAGAMGSNESALMVLKACLRPQELYLGAVVGVVCGRLRMSAAIGLLGRGGLGTSSVFAYVLLLLINCGRERRTEEFMLGSRARASWWALWLRSNIGDGSARTGRDQ